MINIKKLTITILLLSVYGCTSGPADISKTKWLCNTKGGVRTCNVSFVASNKSHFPANSIIRIRAHQESTVMGSDAIVNNVVGDKVLKVIIKPEEKREFKETLKVTGGVTNIVVTIASKEI